MADSPRACDGDHVFFNSTSPVEATLLDESEEDEDSTKKPTSKGVTSQKEFRATEGPNHHRSIVDADLSDNEDDKEVVNSAQNKGWRSNWFVRTFLAEVPVVGHFFRDPNCSDAVYFSAKSVFKLAVGTTMMVLVPVQQEESEEARIFKLAAAMTVGKAAGAVVYNTISSGIRALYDYCLKSHLISLLSKDDDAGVEFVIDGKNEVAVNNEAKGWRNNWLVRTVLVEVPIVGHFFREKCSDALYFAGQSVCELTAGGIAMALVPVKPEASREEELTARFIAVTVGMYAGDVIYKVVGSACNGMIMLRQCYLKREGHLLAQTIKKEEKKDVLTASTSFNRISLQKPEQRSVRVPS